MWYKTAKYGTLWDRLDPESEQEIDRILDESTYRTKIIEDGKEKEIRKINFKKLDQLLKKSVLGEKGFLNKIVDWITENEQYAGVWYPKSGEVPLIQTKIFNIPITIKRNLDKIIQIDPTYTFNYIWTRSVIKHEISHAISAAVLPQSSWRETENPDSPEEELYLQSGRLRKEDIRENPKATVQFLVFDKIRNAIFQNKLPAFEKFLSEKLGPNFIKEYLIENLDKSTLPQRAEKIVDLFDEFRRKKNVAALYDKRVNKFSKDELREIQKIESNYRVLSVDGSGEEKRNNELLKRSKLLGPGVDLYYANPEETRSHLAENKELFSLNSVKEFYNRLKYNTPKEEHIPEFLNLVKTIFNEAVIYGDSKQFDHIDNYYKTLGLSSFYNNDIYYKRYDLKFQRQLAKILNENYQQIKQYFNNMLTKKEGE